MIKGPLQGAMAHITVQEISSHWDLDWQRYIVIHAEIKFVMKCPECVVRIILISIETNLLPTLVNIFFKRFSFSMHFNVESFNLRLLRSLCDEVCG